MTFAEMCSKHGFATPVQKKAAELLWKSLEVDNHGENVDANKLLARTRAAGLLYGKSSTSSF